jgi:hypothetical protein
LFIAYSLQLTAAYAASVNSRDLIENAARYNGRKIDYSGEAVTAILNRGDHSWVSVNDGSNTIGVWCESASAAAIGRVGDYKNNGDIVVVNGVLNRACLEHGGELDIHADSLRVAHKGCAAREITAKNKFVLSASLFLISLCVVILFRKRL